MYTFPPGAVDDTAKLGPKYVVAYAGVAYTATSPISASKESVRVFMSKLFCFRTAYKGSDSAVHRHEFRIHTTTLPTVRLLVSDRKKRSGASVLVGWMKSVFLLTVRSRKDGCCRREADLSHFRPKQSRVGARDNSGAEVRGIW
jgi:hypothetical protein